MPAESAERQLISAILHKQYPVNSYLPPERELAGLLQVTRPTLREVLQRLARDGWLEIQHGKPTRVKNYLTEGRLSLLDEISLMPEHRLSLLNEVLQLRGLLAPTYTRLAVENNAEDSATCMTLFHSSLENPESYAASDWKVHYELAILSANTLFNLILKNMERSYQQVMAVHFELPDNRQKAGTAYRMIAKAARVGEPEAAEAVMKRYTQDTLS